MKNKDSEYIADTIGGLHSEGLGWDPFGNFCGECCLTDCAKCRVWLHIQEEDILAVGFFAEDVEKVIHQLQECVLEKKCKNETDDLLKQLKMIQEQDPEQQRLQRIHQSLIGNASQLPAEGKAPVPCGCFYCKKQFMSDAITKKDILEEVDGRETVCCPHCNIDSVIIQRDDITVDMLLLQKMHHRFFHVTERPKKKKEVL